MRLLASPRRRRRVTIVGIVVAVAAPLIYLGIHFSTPGSRQNANGPYVNNDRFYRHPKHVPFTAEKQHAVKKVLARFIGSAVARRNVSDSWSVAGPALRNGLTRKQWSTGNIPVVPYPVAKHGQGAWDVVQYSYRNKVGLEVLLFPKARSGYSLATVDADVVRGHDGRWRVNYWMITKFHGPGAAAPSDSSSALGEGPPNVHKLPGKHKRAGDRAARHRAGPRAAAPVGPTHAGRSWLLIPLGLLSLVILLPLGIGTFVWIRNRRAEANYRRAS